MKKLKEKTYYYKSYDEDVVQSKNQNYKIKDDYKWIHNNIFYRFFSFVLYSIAYVMSWFYCRFILHVKIKNKKILKKYKKQGYFLYCNHTQLIGDVFTPAHICNKKIYIVVSQANLGVAGIGPVLPMLGALPTSDNIKHTKKLFDAVIQRINEKKCVVIYPEAHVWPYYTKIRPFVTSAFKFPVFCNAPCFCITTTYYKRKLGKKPGIQVYVDGPFVPDNALNKKEKQEKICTQIQQKMIERSKNSTYQYIKYKEEK